MPWRGPRVPNEFPTLGYAVADWIEDNCVIPDREWAGNPLLLTDEQLRFLLHYYRIDPDTGRFFYHRGGQLVRPQKWGKGPFSAGLICAEAAGPVKFDGWDANGEPVGMPWATPHIQVTALSEDQTDNVFGALLPMIQLGALDADIPDTGKTRVNLPGGGKIEPVTASAMSRLGQRITFVVQDETHGWNETNKGRKLADNQRRNIAGMGGRWLSTTNAWDPAEESVAQWTAEHEFEGVYHDDVDPPEGLSIRNKSERRRALRAVYGDSVTGTRNGESRGVKPWIDLDRIEAEILSLLPRDPAQAERYFLNRKRSAEAAAFDGALCESRLSSVWPKLDGRLVVLGIDGARFNDALAVIGTDVMTGFQWPVGIWERPDDADEGYEHPRDEIDAAVADVFERCDVWRAYIDPQYIDNLVSAWQGRYGEKRVIPWYTNRLRQMAWAVRAYTDAMTAGDVSLSDGDPTFVTHLKQAVRRKVNVWDDEHRQMYVIAKDRAGSPRKIDAAAAAVISWEARSDAIAAGAKPRSQYRTRGWS